MTARTGCLFGNGSAVVIGLPADFDLRSTIREASEIRLATAFAHWSGWEFIARAVRESRAQSRLLTGLDFCQTEPEVLRDWLTLVNAHRAAARLYWRTSATFHPKVLIISTPRLRFAIVGSGNLSAGGLRDNVECSVFVDRGPLLNALESWFDTVFRDDTATKRLSNFDIVEYEPRFKRARRHARAIRKSQREVESKIAKQHNSRLLRWTEAIAAAKKYLKSADFKSWYPAEKKAAAKDLRSALDYPAFRFSRAGWDEFYSVSDLGRLRQAWKNPAWAHREKIQNGFRQLVDDGLAPEGRLSAVLDSGGKYRVQGVGRNVVSKVLAVHGPREWPVYNSPVAETLKAFGYDLPRGLSASAKYLAFAEMMRKFMRDSGAPDMLALDCFFYWYSRLR